MLHNKKGGNKMDYLYKTTTKFTLEEYKKFNKALIKKRHLYLLSIIAVAFILASGILLKNIFLIIFAVIYPFLFLISMNIGVKRTFNSNKLLQNVEVEYEFYNDYLLEKHEGGEAKVPYEKLDEIIETKTNFYLMIAKNQGFMISKENFPEGLEDFIKNLKK